jgi:hypothetical protein
MSKTKNRHFEWVEALRLMRSLRKHEAAEASPLARPQPPRLRVVGDTAHADFRDALSIMRGDALMRLHSSDSSELVVVAQSRPDGVSHAQYEQLQRESPLAGILSLLGSWCEGETRTGKPWKGAHRVFWYDFPEWWRRQMRLRNAGQCPDWARVPDFGLSAVADKLLSDHGLPECVGQNLGVILLYTPRRATAEALSDVFNQCGYSTAWHSPGRPRPFVKHVVAGVWDGGQLDDFEAADLAGFCAQSNVDATPVVALLDFPRRDRVDLAMNVGAAVVLAKPWVNNDLVAAVNSLVNQRTILRAA